MRKKFLSIIIVAIMFVGLIGFNSLAKEKKVINVEKEILEQLKKGYEKYYDINLNNSTIEIVCSSVVNGYKEDIYFVNLNSILKVKSVEELSSYKGMLNYYGLNDNNTASFEKLELEQSLNNIITFDKKQNIEEISNYLSEMYDYYNQFIGKEQMLSFYIMAQIDTRTDKITLFAENGKEYIPIENIYPVEETKLENEGYKLMQEQEILIQEKNNESVMDNIELSNSVLLNASNVSLLSTKNKTATIAYTGTYSSNPTNCSKHGSSCGILQNTSKWNLASYGYYVDHNDCANFISQAMYAGGFSMDSTWYATKTTASSAWVGVSALTTYMVNKGYWTKVNSSSATIGTVMSATTYSHVMMITAFDGVSYRITAHTNDRLNVVQSLTSSFNYYNINF